MNGTRCPWCGHDVDGCGKRCENCRAVVYCRDDTAELFSAEGTTEPPLTRNVLR